MSKFFKWITIIWTFAVGLFACSVTIGQMQTLTTLDQESEAAMAGAGFGLIFSLFMYFLIWGAVAIPSTALCLITKKNDKGEN